MQPSWRPRPARQARARFSSLSMAVSARSRSQVAAFCRAALALVRNEGVPPPPASVNGGPDGGSNSDRAAGAA
eukprot:15446982-Alexandrium_andersonii.AAC.1